MHHLKTSYSSLLLIRLVLLAVVFITPYSGASAQSSSEKLSNQQKFQEELDTWMLRAYEGDRDAQFKVGVLFTNDQFSQPDFEQAVYWYKQAARQDHILAQYNLGHQYLNGVGVEKSTEAAMQWWLKAANLGHSLAQYNIGRAYYLGIGLTENQQQAKYWFQQAANNQEPKSIAILKELGWENDPQVKSVVRAIEPKIIDEPAAAVDDEPAQQENQLSAQATADASSTDYHEHYPIALYTNPKVRSILISTVNNRSRLNVVKKSDEWSVVRHDDGFPIWVHSDFIQVNGEQGIITGNSVNARSIPIIVRGSIIEKLNKDEKVAILSHVGEWYRVTSPPRFQAWVRTPDLKPLTGDAKEPSVVAVKEPSANKKPSASKEPSANKKPSASKKPSANKPAPEATTPQTVNSNEWLFAQETSGYTIQLASFDTQEKVNTFLKKTKLKNDPNLHQFTSQSKKIRWTYFLYGGYPDKAAATKVKSKLAKKQSWVRNIGKLQQNRCISWKKQIPSPKELNLYCTPPSN